LKLLDVVELTNEVLRSNGYETFDIDQEEVGSIGFENEINFGFVLFYKTPPALVENWKQDSEALFGRYRFQIQRGGSKAWNAYSVFLCGGKPSRSEALSFSDIEEDLSGSRKLARSAVGSDDSIKIALQPLIGLGHAPMLEPVDLEEDVRLISSELPNAALDAFFREARPDEVLRLLGRADEN
jgi:hypothetical protein|tara:strand:+ start:716 stop:1264 length:549 start_codon:yes stop_codon:yes gene_type:complete